MKKQILYTDKLCKTFSNEGIQQHILKNVDVSIYEGDYTIFMGASGAGKSTLLYALSGMDKLSLGKIFYQDEEISNYSDDRLAVFRRKHCGFVFQQVYMMENMSLFDNAMVAGLLINKDKKKVSSVAKKLFDQVNLPEQTYRKSVGQVSGGEAQRAGIVRGLVNEPDILFADEPTGALNSANTKAVLDVLTKVNENGQSIVMVTHDRKAALRGNRILYLKDGKICGECNLGSYEEENQERKQKMDSFLEEMGY